MKEIRVTSEQEFERLIQDLSTEASRANDPWYLVKGLDSAFDQYALEMHQTLSFWHITMRSLYDATLSFLVRLYDQYPGTCSLGNFLHTVKRNPDYFSEASLRQRLHDRMNLEGLIERSGIDPVELDQEIASVSESDPLVRKLVALRNQRIAHRSGNDVRLATISSNAGLTVNETDTLLSRAGQIISKYSLKYRASVVAQTIQGADDYQYLLKLVKQSVDFNAAQLEAEISKMSSTNPNALQ